VLEGRRLMKEWVVEEVEWLERNFYKIVLGGKHIAQSEWDGRRGVKTGKQCIIWRPRLVNKCLPDLSR
jgi:hypothetical protein